MTQHDLVIAVALTIGGIGGLVLMVLVEGWHMVIERQRRIRLARYRSMWKKA